jgi:hypothetical protein
MGNADIPVQPLLINQYTEFRNTPYRTGTPEATVE